MGDINGIGTEVVITALADERVLDHFTPIIYGSSKVVAYYKNIVKADLQFSSISQVHIHTFLRVSHVYPRHICFLPR